VQQCSLHRGDRDTVDSMGNYWGWSASITIGTDGLPVLTYYDGTNQDLKVAKCGNTACTTNTSPLSIRPGLWPARVDHDRHGRLSGHLVL